MADCALPACSGKITAPTEILVATAPTVVSMTLSRIVAISRRGDGLESGSVAIVQHDAELVGGEAADAVLAAQGAPEAAPDDGDHLVADVEAVSLVDQGEIVDAGKQEGAFGRARPALDRRCVNSSVSLVRLSCPVSSSWLPR